MLNSDRDQSRDRDRQSCLADRLADNIGLRIRFDTGVDMLGGVWRNCTYVTRVLGPTALPATRSLRNSPTKKPRDIARGFVLIEETRQPTSCALPSLCVLRYFPNGLLLPLASST